MKLPLVFCILFSSLYSSAQQTIALDSSIAQDAVFNRPFYKSEKLPISIGGYAEVNWQHVTQDGITSGHQLQARRLSIFLSSTISKHIKFLSEIEFEDGGAEIGVEYAAVDIEFSPMLNLRGGIVLNPIGSFNQNHDGPKWEFTNRPVVSSQLLPATWSNTGIGLYGKLYKNKWMFGYEVYLTGGLDSTLISNSNQKTYLRATKKNHARFEEIPSGLPMLNAKLSFKQSGIGEFGLSYAGGVYNAYKVKGVQVDEKRRCDMFAIDYAKEIKSIRTSVFAEYARIFVDVPSHVPQHYGNAQHGFVIDFVHTLLEKKILKFDEAKVLLGFRLDYADWNLEKMDNTNTKIRDDIKGITPFLSFRPTDLTVIRFNYSFMRAVGYNASIESKTTGFSLGLSSYF